MDNVGIVVDDLEAAAAFFVELGLELEGETRVEGRWVDGVVGLDDVRVDVAMVQWSWSLRRQWSVATVGAATKITLWGPGARSRCEFGCRRRVRISGPGSTPLGSR
jgi:hypothetical protein